MSLVKPENSKKWINAFVAVVAILAGYFVIKFLEQLGEWFDLEARIKYFLGVSQAIGILVGLITFLTIIKRKQTSIYLNEVYSEISKAVWPDNDSVVKTTIGIIIGLAIMSGLFVGVDFIFSRILDLIY